MEHKHHSESFEEQEIRLWKRRLWGAWVFAIPIAIVMLLDRVFGYKLLVISLASLYMFEGQAHKPNGSIPIRGLLSVYVYKLVSPKKLPIGSSLKNLPISGL